MPKKESTCLQVLRLYLSKRDDHGVGIESGLTVRDISYRFRWKKRKSIICFTNSEGKREEIG